MPSPSASTLASSRSPSPSKSTRPHPCCGGPDGSGCGICRAPQPVFGRIDEVVGPRERRRRGPRGRHSRHRRCPHRVVDETVAVEVEAHRVEPTVRIDVQIRGEVHVVVAPSPVPNQYSSPSIPLFDAPHPRHGSVTVVIVCAAGEGPADVRFGAHRCRTELMVVPRTLTSLLAATATGLALASAPAAAQTPGPAAFTNACGEQGFDPSRARPQPTPTDPPVVDVPLPYPRLVPVPLPDPVPIRRGYRRTHCPPTRAPIRARISPIPSTRRPHPMPGHHPIGLRVRFVLVAADRDPARPETIPIPIPGDDPGPEPQPAPAARRRHHRAGSAHRTDRRPARAQRRTGVAGDGPRLREPQPTNAGRCERHRPRYHLGEPSRRGLRRLRRHLRARLGPAGCERAGLAQQRARAQHRHGTSPTGLTIDSMVQDRRCHAAEITRLPAHSQLGDHPRSRHPVSRSATVSTSPTCRCGGWSVVPGMWTRTTVALPTPNDGGRTWTEDQHAKGTTSSESDVSR